MELTTHNHIHTNNDLLFMMSKIQNLNGTHNLNNNYYTFLKLFMMSKIQNLNGTHNFLQNILLFRKLFMMSKIQNLNGTHNVIGEFNLKDNVVYDVKDTKFEWNSQLLP